MPGLDAPRIPLSIVVGTSQPWPAIRTCFDSLYSQAEALGAEIILVDCTGQGMAEGPDSPFPKVIWLKKPRLSVYQLRAAGLEQARGEVVAVTEDHCRPAADWCVRILEAHRRHPLAAAVGGSVENGSADTMVSWASFFLGHGVSMAPVETAFQKKTAFQANVAYKRRVVPRDLPPHGYMEWMLNADLIRRGEQVIADDRIRVEHVQTFTFSEACLGHYSAGRSVAAFRLEQIGAAERVWRTAACLAMAPLVLFRSLSAIVRKGRFSARLVQCVPVMGLLAVCRAAGAFMGFVFGIGESALRVQ